MSKESVLCNPELSYSANEALILTCFLLRELDINECDLNQDDFTSDVTLGLYCAIKEFHIKKNKVWDVNDFMDYLRRNYKDLNEHSDLNIGEWLNSFPLSLDVINGKITQIKNNAEGYKIIKIYEEASFEMKIRPHDIINISQKAQERVRLILLKNKEKYSFSIDESLKSSIELYCKNFEGEKAVNGIETGYQDIDELTGGLIPGKIFGIAAPPGGCKTTLALNLLLNCILRGNKCLFFSLEMEIRSEIIPRLLSSLTKISYNDIFLGKFIGNPELATIVNDGAIKLQRCPLIIAESYYNTLDRLLDHARNQFYRNTDLKVIFIDHLHEIRIEGSKKDENSVVSEIVSRLKDLAQELGVAIVLLCQLNKSADNKLQKYVPSMRDLKGSSRIEETVNTLIILEKSTDCSEIKFHCVKNRSGRLFETSHYINYETAKINEETKYGLQK